MVHIPVLDAATAAAPNAFQGRLRLARWAELYYATLLVWLAVLAVRSPGNSDRALLSALQVVGVTAIAIWLPRRSRAALFGALCVGAVAAPALVPAVVHRLLTAHFGIVTFLFLLGWLAQLTVLACCLSIPEVRAELRARF